MEERYVRCRRCHGVFESGVTNCPRCGAEYVAIEAPIASSEGSYEDRYKGTEYVAPVEAPQVLPKQQGSRYGLMLGAGALLTVAGLVVVMLVMAGVLGMPSATDEPEIIYAVTPRPTPGPTLPPAFANTLLKIADPDFNGHLSIRTTVAVSASANNGRAAAQSVNVEADMANRQITGTYQVGNVNREYRLVDGIYYSRLLPNGTWAVKPNIPPFLLLSPLFAHHGHQADRVRRCDGAAWRGAPHRQHGLVLSGRGEIDEPGHVHLLGPDPVRDAQPVHRQRGDAVVRRVPRLEATHLTGPTS